MSVPTDRFFDGYRMALADLHFLLQKKFEDSKTVTFCPITTNSTSIYATITGPHGSSYNGVCVVFDPHAYVCSKNSNYTVYLTRDGIITFIVSTELKFPKQVFSIEGIVDEIRLVERNKNRKSITSSSSSL